MRGFLAAVVLPLVACAAGSAPPTRPPSPAPAMPADALPRPHRAAGEVAAAFLWADGYGPLDRAVAMKGDAEASARTCYQAALRDDPTLMGWMDVDLKCEFRTPCVGVTREASPLPPSLLRCVEDGLKSLTPAEGMYGFTILVYLSLR